MEPNKLLTVVLLSYYSGNRIERAYQNLALVLDKAQIPFEFIIMDDGSKDDSYVHAVGLAKRFPNVRAYRLSRNYGAVYSSFAACSLMRGDCLTFIHDDEQQPYETIVDAYRLWEAGHKLILPQRRTRADSRFSSWLSNTYYNIMNALSDVTFPPGGCDIVFADRELIEIINTRISHHNTHIAIEMLQLGYDPVFLPYDRPLGLNEGKSRWTLRKKVRLAMDTFVASSSFPIKCITVLGLFFSGIALVMVPLYIYITLFGNRQFWGMPVPGWTSLFIALCFFSGLILFALGMIAEYIYRIFEEVKNRPAWIIRQSEEEI